MGYKQAKRWAGSMDKNQPDICARLDKLHIPWHDVSRLGSGFSDLLVELMFQGREHLVLIEVKNPSRYAQGLICENELKKERLFCRMWGKHVAVIMEPDEVNQLMRYFAAKGKVFPPYRFEKRFPLNGGLG